jgi:esterase/lipase
MEVNEQKLYKNLRNRVMKSFIGTVSIIALLILLVPPIIVYFATQNHVEYMGSIEEHPLQDIYKPEDFDLDAVEKTLVTKDGFKIWMSEVFVDNPKAVIIYLSGILQPSVTYFYGHSKWMKSNGYATILLEVRGHGNSDGDRVCLGYDEVADVRAVVEYIKEQEKYQDVPIVFHGVSLGGAIAINSFGSIKEADGLIAMSAFSSFEDVVCDEMRNYNIPQFICDIEKPLVREWLKLVFGDKINEIKPIKQIENIGDRPALLIACTGDTEVPPVNMQRLLDKAPASCESWLRDSWEHFIVQECDFVNIEQDEEYCKKILDFMEKRILMH